IPNAEGHWLGFGIEADELLDAEAAILFQLVIPVPIARVFGADDFDGDVRRASLPHLPASELIIRDTEADEGVGRQALAGIGRVPIHGPITTDRCSLGECQVEDLVKRRSLPEVTFAL